MAVLTMTTRQHGTALERDVSPVDDGFMAFVNADRGSRRMMVREAKRTYADFRQDFGYAGSAALLTAPDAQPKTGKNSVPTFTLMLEPATTVLGNACPGSTAGCRSACLNTAGRGGFAPVAYARHIRMAFLVTWPFEFGVLLAHEITRQLGAFGAIGFRPNCVSDIRWEISTPRMLAWLAANSVSVYDYTAWAPRLRAAGPEYRLTYSAKENHTVDAIRELIAGGHNVAVPFAVRKGQPLPATWHGMRVIDGDVTDYRPSDPQGVIVGLRAKGAAIKDESGFVRKVA
jgi:hypothetical protein